MAPEKVEEKKDTKDKHNKHHENDESDEESAARDPGNLPGLEMAREAANIWGQLATANIDAYNALWAEMRQGKVSFKSLLSHSTGSIQRSVEDIGQLMRFPFVDTDRPDWAIFWYDLGLTNKAMVKEVSLGRRYPSTLELHRTDLQLLGQEANLDASHYSATLGPDGRTLVVQLEKISGNPKLGDYVGLVTAQGLRAPLAVVMVTLRNMGPLKAEDGNGAPRNQQRTARRKRPRGGAASTKAAAAAKAKKRRPAAKEATRTRRRGRPRP